MKHLNLTFTSLALFIGCIMLAQQSKPVTGVLFFLPFALGPLIVTLILSAFCKRPLAHGILLSSTILYFLWFTFIYLSAFYWHIDAQSAIALLFVGIYSLPVMIPLWIIAFNKRHPAGH